MWDRIVTHILTQIHTHTHTQTHTHKLTNLYIYIFINNCRWQRNLKIFLGGWGGGGRLCGLVYGIISSIAGGIALKFEHAHAVLFRIVRNIGTERNFGRITCKWHKLWEISDSGIPEQQLISFLKFKTPNCSILLCNWYLFLRIFWISWLWNVFLCYINQNNLAKLSV